jgi:hypothetical protein
MTGRPAGAQRVALTGAGICFGRRQAHRANTAE